MTNKKQQQHQDVKDAVHAAVKSGDDVHQQVKDITLKALTKGRLDVENIQNVTEAVGKGINEGMASYGEHGKEVFMQAVKWTPLSRQIMS